MEAVILEDQNENSNVAETIATIESLINSHIAVRQKYKDERQAKKSMLSDVLRNSEEFYKLESQKKELNKKIKELTAELMQANDQIELMADVRELNQKIKDENATISDYLVHFEKIAEGVQLTLFNGADPEFVEIKLQGQIKRKRSIGGKRK